MRPSYRVRYWFRGSHAPRVWWVVGQSGTTAAEARAGEFDPQDASGHVSRLLRLDPLIEAEMVEAGR